MFKKINKKLLPIKLHYFLFNAGTGPLVPFLSVYAKQLGFSSVTVGTIYTILSLTGMLAKPLFGAIADHFKCQRQIFLISILLCALSFFSLKYTPEVSVERKVHFSCYGKDSVFDISPVNIETDNCLFDNLKNEYDIVKCELSCPIKNDDWNEINHYWNLNKNFSNIYPSKLNFIANIPKNSTDNMGIFIFLIKNITMFTNETYKPFCSKRLSSICDVNCDDYRLNELSTKTLISDNETYKLYQFWIFLFLMIFMWVSQAICVSVGDAICFELLEDKPHHYGNQRLFGALGWGFITIITGIMIDSFSKNNSKTDFTSAFYLAISILIIDFFISLKIKYTQRKHSSNIAKDIGRLLFDIRVIIFILWCIAIGMCTGIMWNFLFWLVEELANKKGCDSQNWIKTLEGIIMAIQTLGGEVPFFFLSGCILKRIGHTNAMSLIPLIIGIRFILYSIISNPWYFLPIELLNGLTFGLFYACMTSYASIVAPSGTEATMQGLVGAVFEGIGVSLGSVIPGFLFKIYGASLTFRYFGIGALVVCLLHAVIQYLLKSRDHEVKYTIPKNTLNIFEEDQQELTLVSS